LSARAVPAFAELELRRMDCLILLARSVYRQRENTARILACHQYPSSCRCILDKCLGWIVPNLAVQIAMASAEEHNCWTVSQPSLEKSFASVVVHCLAVHSASLRPRLLRLCENTSRKLNRRQ
jgi:hypothetical protein